MTREVEFENTHQAARTLDNAFTMKYYHLYLKKIAINSHKRTPIKIGGTYGKNGLENGASL